VTTPDLAPATAFIAAMQTALTPVGLFIVNRRNLPQNNIWPRYVVERVDIVEAPLRTQGNPRSFSADDHQIAFHCWGQVESDCEKMRQALVTSARQYLQGRNYTVQSSVWTEPTWAQTGFVLTVMLVVTLPFAKAILPGTTPPAPYPSPSTSVGNDTKTTVVVETDQVDSTFI